MTTDDGTDDSAERIRGDLMLAMVRLDLLASQGRLRLRASGVHGWTDTGAAVAAFAERLANARIVLEDLLTEGENDSI